MQSAAADLCGLRSGISQNRSAVWEGFGLPPRGRLSVSKQPPLQLPFGMTFAGSKPNQPRV